MATVTRGHGLVEEWLARLRARQANRFISPGHRTGRILDIGCGMFPFFLNTTRFAEKYGLDKIQSDAAGKDIHFVRHDVETSQTLPFDDESFDVVTMLAVFEHIEPEQLVLLLAEIRRVLKPHGVYIMTTPAHWSDGLLRVMAFLRLVSCIEIGEHKDAYSHANIRGLLNRAGYPDTAITLGYFELYLNIWCVARKLPLPESVTQGLP